MDSVCPGGRGIRDTRQSLGVCLGAAHTNVSYHDEWLSLHTRELSPGKHSSGRAIVLSEFLKTFGAQRRIAIIVRPTVCVFLTTPAAAGLRI